MDSEISTVGIIGGGIAGLCTAKVLSQFGFEVAVLEQESDVGGVWSASRRYPGLTTQNPRETYEFSDFPMPRNYPEWPTGAQMQAYLQSYAAAFGLTSSIFLGTRVERVAYREDTRQWLVDMSSASEGAARRVFDFLIVCNGIFSIPSIPEFSGAEEFRAAGGRILHTSTFTSLEDVRGKHLLVVGYGKSSCDAANATLGVSASTHLIARTVIWKIPKKLFNVLNFKHLFLTRMGEALFRYIRVKGFERFLHGPGKPVRDALLGTVERIVARQLDLNALGLHPGRPLETIARSTVSLATDGFYDNVRAGMLRVSPRARITKLSAGRAHLSTGENVPADLIVCGTGWQQLVPFFADDVRARITDERGNFRLYQTLLPVGIPHLAFNGYNSSFFSQLNAEVGALWLAAYLKGRITLPSLRDMNERIDERLRWMEERTDGKHSKGTNIIPFSVHQMDELLADIELQLSVLTRLRQWLTPVKGSDYRGLAPRLLERLRKSA